MFCKEIIYFFLCLCRPLSRPSCITDRNVFRRQNVGQLCRPPPFVTFNLTTISLTATIRQRHLCDITPVYPMTVQFTHCDTGALESLPTVGLAVTSTVHPQSWIVLMKSCCASLWSLSFQSKKVKSELWKGNLRRWVFQTLLIIPPLYNFWGDKQFICWFRLFNWFLCLISRQGESSVIVFGELDRRRTYWHIYCRMQTSAIPHLHPPPNLFFFYF